MPTVPNAARPAHPHGARPGEWLPTRLAPLAAELAGTIRDYDLAVVHQVLAAVPDTQRTDLILVLAAMVDVDRTPAELLEWTGTPVQSREDNFDVATPPSKRRVPCPDCGLEMRADHVGRHRRIKHADDDQMAA